MIGDDLHLLAVNQLEVGDTAFLDDEVHQQVKEQKKDAAKQARGDECFAEEGDYEKALYYIGLGISVGDPAAMESLLFNEIVIYERMNDFSTAKQKMMEFLKSYPLDTSARREYKFLSPRP